MQKYFQVFWLGRWAAWCHHLFVQFGSLTEIWKSWSEMVLHSVPLHSLASTGTFTSLDASHKHLSGIFRWKRTPNRLIDRRIQIHLENVAPKRWCSYFGPLAWLGIARNIVIIVFVLAVIIKLTALKAASTRPLEAEFPPGLSMTNLKTFPKIQAWFRAASCNRSALSVFSKYSSA
jgi:hypothetical protein